MTPEQAATKYSFVKLGADGVVELYADNHMLSSLRRCEGYFSESILASLGGKWRSWPLEFGQWFHYCMEFYYKHEMEEKNLTIEEFCLYGIKLWDKMKMEEFSETKNYKTLAGKMGAMGLLGAYHQVHWEKERLRTVGLELGFGKHKEVPIIASHTDFPFAPFRAYYTGRIDRLTDNGSVIAPLDHKSTAYFDGKERGKFNPHDGMLGYVYSTRTIVRTMFPELEREGRLCNSIIINHVSLRPSNNPLDRFKRSSLIFSPLQLENWRLRQVTTFAQLYELVINERMPTWNTDFCSNWFHHECPFKALHELAPESRELAINQGYVQIKPWSPYPDDQAAKEAEEKVV